MPPEERRRKKQSPRYEILFVPQGEGGRRRSFRTSKSGLWLSVVGVLVLVTVGAVALLVYTPIVVYLPVKNPELEARYGKRILETQQRLNELAEEVLVVRDYNQQLRKALGEFGGKDSSAAKTVPPVRMTRGTEPAVEDSAYDGMDDLSGNPEGYAGEEDGPVSKPAVERTVPRGSFPLLEPTNGFETQGFDPSSYHFGIDFAVKTGTPVYAATDGYVLFSGWTYDDGNMVILAHGGGYLTVYKHNDVLLTSIHAFVKKGEMIAQSGSTGQTSAGPHLHFEVWKDGLPQDPQQYLLTAPKIQ